METLAKATHKVISVPTVDTKTEKDAIKYKFKWNLTVWHLNVNTNMFRKE